MEEGRIDDNSLHKETEHFEIKEEPKTEIIRDEPSGEPKEHHEFKLPKKPKEPKYELLMGQLILGILVGIFLALGAGYMLGKEIGVSKALSDLPIDKPDYCTVDKVGGTLTIRCSELKNVTLDSLCTWISPELKDRIRIMIISDP